jgi:aldehyde:ferredoxin oxidoreductase
MSFGCQLKHAGFDHIIIQGRSEHPVYLNINDGCVEIADARALRGMGIRDTCALLRRDAGRHSGIVGFAGHAILLGIRCAVFDRKGSCRAGGQRYPVHLKM